MINRVSVEFYPNERLVVLRTFSSNSSLAKTGLEVVVEAGAGEKDRFR